MRFVFGGSFVGRPIVMRFAPDWGVGSRCSACLVTVTMIVMPGEVGSERRCLRMGTGGDIEKFVHVERDLSWLGLRRGRKTSNEGSEILGIPGYIWNVSSR